MRGILRALVVMLAAAGWIAAGPSPALAQTRPAVTSLGPDFPRSEIFIGNSFFYYNNGMPGHLSLLEKAADPDHKQDYRATMVTIGGSGLDWHDVESYFRPNAIGNYSFDDHNNVVFDKREQIVRCRGHDGLQPMPDPSQTQGASSPNMPKRTATSCARMARDRCSSCPGPMPTSRR